MPCRYLFLYIPLLLHIPPGDFLRALPEGSDPITAGFCLCRLHCKNQDAASPPRSPRFPQALPARKAPVSPLKYCQLSVQACGLLYFLSRQDGQIKHMGYRIELGEIETALHSVDGIAAAACLFDRNRDRIVCIYEGEPDAAALARAMRRLVPKYMLPNIYEKLDALPMNANGKIDRVKLKEQFIHAED